MFFLAFIPLVIVLVWFFVVNPLVFKYSAKMLKISSEITWWSAFKSLFVAALLSGIAGFIFNPLIALILSFVIYFFIIKKELKKYNPAIKKVFLVFILIMISSLLSSQINMISLRLLAPEYVELTESAQELEAEFNEILQEAAEKSQAEEGLNQIENENVVEQELIDEEISE